MPYVTNVAGTTITAAWGNANVRDQVITPFASAAARASAVTSPVEGMVSHLNDVNVLLSFDGTAYVPLQYTFVARSVSTGTVTATTTETTAISCTFTAVANRRYRVTLTGATKSSNAGDVVQFRGRYKAGSSVDSTGTLFTTFAYVALTITAPGVACPVQDFVTGLTAGQYTIGITIQRFAGSGTVELNHSAGVNENVLLIEDVGSSL